MKTNHLAGYLLLLILIINLTYGCHKRPEKEGIHNLAELSELFQDPPSEYRSAPLWDWNEKISEEGIDFQMQEFKNAGIGGVFIHPRPGLLTEYLSDDWFQLFSYTVKKGKELGMKVWIYDENSYPSGFAGGHVPAEMPDSYRHGTGLSMEVVRQLNINLSDTVAVILKKIDSGFIDITDNVDNEKGQTADYYVFRKTYPAPSPWYGGFTYVDLLYPGVTDKFIELTMTKGYENSIADFGVTVPGVFTDEPNLEAAMSRGSFMRWTPGLWDSFQQRRGYDLRENLPSLAEETGNWKKVRHDYYVLILELFTDRWAKPWSKYCDEKGLKWTGHYWEHGWPEPTHGFDEAAFYIWHQQPGVDMLGNRLDTAGSGGQFGNDRAVRELRSAANQAGRTRTLSETYGGGGWEMSFETQKRLLDWQCVLGVNFVNQHLSYYSLNGVRKFDYPPSFSYHEPWWKHYKLLGDYTGRICMAMSSGEQINKILVLQPNSTAWMYFSRTVHNPAVDSIRNGFKNFVYLLEQNHMEYDLGSEYVLKTLGSVKNDLLTVGERDYSLVVIPAQMENINRETFDLLTKYLSNGGRVLSFNRNIEYLDGAESSEVRNLAGQYPEQWTFTDNLKDMEAIKLLTNDQFEMNDLTHNGMLYHQRRILDDGQLVFVVNSHSERRAEAEITLEGKYLYSFDLVSGEVYPLPVKRGKGKITFKTGLEPAGSALYAVTGKKLESKIHALSSKNTSEIKSSGHIETKTGDKLLNANGTQIEKTGPVEVKREDDNIMVINYLDLKTARSEKKGIYFMDALIGLFREKGVDMGNPWQHKIQYKQQYLALDSLFKDDSGFEVIYHFYIDESLGLDEMRSIRAVTERPALWEVSINGQPATSQEGSYWIDRDFPVYPAGQFLKAGENIITLKAPRMHILAELMPVYLTGDFLVKPSKQGFEITGGRINAPGSWIESGLPFYSQKVAYSQIFNVSKKPGSSYKVKLTEWNGSVAEVLAGGQHAGLIAWKPYELDVTEFLHDGENELTVRIYGSLKNTFGFFYQKNEGWIFGPFSWNSAPEKIPSASEYFLPDYGLFKPFELIQINQENKKARRDVGILNAYIPFIVLKND